VSYDEAFQIELLSFYENVAKRHKPLTGIVEAVEHMRFVQEIATMIGSKRN
jgi:hypothetical protein